MLLHLYLSWYQHPSLKELRILDFDNLFQQWLSVSIKDFVILSSLERLMEQLSSTKWLTGLGHNILIFTVNKSVTSSLSVSQSEHRIFYTSGRLLELHNIKWTILTVETLSLLVLFCNPKYCWDNLTVFRNVTAFHFGRQVFAAVHWR